MRVLITGATGFIGGHILRHLQKQGHEVIAGLRKTAPAIPGARLMAVDFSQDHDPAVWLPRLEGVDAVVNCVGIIAESPGQSFDALHRDAPCALFRACAQAGVKRVIQISALGADAEAFSRYHRSKHAADELLAGLGLDHAILQPSLVFGPGGPSMGLLAAMAALPVVPLIGDGNQPVQPVQVEDLCVAVARLLEAEPSLRGRIPAVGAEALDMRALYGLLRAWLGLPPPRFVPIPVGWVLKLADWAGRLAPSSFNLEAIQMLLQGSTADTGAFRAVLGTAPLGVGEVLRQGPASAGERSLAGLFFSLPLLRLSLALLWIATGWISAFVFPAAESYGLLARAGVTGWAAPWALYGTAGLDALLGLGLLLRYRVRLVCALQILLMLAYSLAIAVFLPEYWLHPYTPVLKNIPLIAATWLLLSLETR